MKRKSVVELENVLNSNYASSEEYFSDENIPKQSERQRHQPILKELPLVISKKYQIGKGPSKLDLAIDDTKRKVEKKRFH